MGTGSLALVGSTRRQTTTYPTTSQRVEITTADSAMRDLDIDVGLFPWLRLELSPIHVALGGGGVVAQPAFELVVCCHLDRPEL